MGYANPAWDTAMNEVLASKDATARKAAYKKLADLWNVDVPSVVYETQIERVAFQNKVHGIYLTDDTIFYLDKTWIEK